MNKTTETCDRSFYAMYGILQQKSIQLKVNEGAGQEEINAKGSVNHRGA
jgi:hypothetical protein